MFQKEPFTKNITMKIDDKTKDEKQQYDINAGQHKHQYYHQVKLINMSLL